MWRHTSVSGTGDSTRPMPELRQGEAGTIRLFGGQSVLHQALCDVRWSPDLSGRPSAMLPKNCIPPLAGRSRNSRKQYMQEQLRRAPKPRPKVIGIDEISVRKGHTYRIVVSDLGRRCPIWFGGKDRSEESMNMFYQWLGSLKTKRIRLAVMDMWKPFENAASVHIPQAAILYDKFHIIRHLGEALDKIRKQEYARVSGNKRRFIKGQKYHLLSHQENLTLSAKQALYTLLKANKRLNTAYVLKESFGQLWDYRSEVPPCGILRQLESITTMATIETV